MIDTIERAKMFYENKTFTFIQTLDDKFYNGEIYEVFAEYLIIKDRYLGKFPILFKEIKKIEPSEVKKNG